MHTFALTDIDGNLLQWQDGNICRADGADICYHQWDVFYSSPESGEGLVVYSWSAPMELPRLDTGGVFDLSLFWLN